jgi:hypothetical protein
VPPVLLEPQAIVSAHGPSAVDSSDQLCAMLAEIATMDPLVLPNQAEFEQMLSAMEASEPPVAPAGLGTGGDQSWGSEHE